MPKQEMFNLTQEHLLLLKHSNIGWSNDYYNGALCVDQKRPYGNSDIIEDIIEILDWNIDPDTLDYNDDNSKIIKKALTLHSETKTALEICLSLLKFEEGTYIKNFGAWEML